MRKNSIATLFGAIILVASAGMPVYAAGVTFNFNALTAGTQGATIAGILSSQLQTQAGCGGCTVTVLTQAAGTGGNPKSTGAVVDSSYNGEGHAVGPSNGSGGYVSETLHNTNGATKNDSFTYAQLQTVNNNFLANTNDGSGTVSDEIALKFNGYTISNSTVSFDYEIFPDNGTQGTADLVFEAGNGSNGVDAAVASFGNAGTQLGVAPSSGSNGSNMHSPLSGNGTELSVQYLGHWSGTLDNVTELDFVDWPATIGINNLKITPNGSQQQAVPEPASVFLFATAVTGALLATRRKTKKV